MNFAEQQHKFFDSGRTLDLDYRARQLRSLYQVILLYQEQIAEALQKDTGKSERESYLTEIGPVLSEISHVLRHLGKWARPNRVGTSITAPFSSAWVIREPFGVALIISCGGYPFREALLPLVSALAAGNCVVLRPGETAQETVRLLAEMLNNNFEARLCTVIKGGPDVTRAILSEDFDCMYFSGPRSQGEQVYAAAARAMIPVTLLLGGKSPCIVDHTANISDAAKRIVWGKFLNAGQSRSAPDYLLVQDSVKGPLLAKMKECIREYYGEEPENNPDYPRILSREHYDRLCEMISEGTVLEGGRTNGEAQKIAPTILENAPFYSKVMTEEISGPILPVVEFTKLQQAIEYIGLHDKPLALYLFSNDVAVEKKIMRNIPFGGGCVNDTMLQTSVHRLPHGGLGRSGIGCVGGKAGFDCFSHPKSLLYKFRLFDIPMRYPPYGKENSRIVKRFFR